MKYYDNTCRSLISELLNGYRKMLEQSMISTNEQNYQILVRDKITKIDEVLKAVKPSMFDALTVQKIEKLQSDRFLKQKAAELEADYEAKLEVAKRELEDKLRTQIEEELRNERAEKKKRKKAKKESDAEMAAKAMELLLKTAQQSGQPVAQQATSQEIPSDEPDENNEDDMFPDAEIDNID